MSIYDQQINGKTQGNPCSQLELTALGGPPGSHLAGRPHNAPACTSGRTCQCCGRLFQPIGRKDQRCRECHVRFDLIASPDSAPPLTKAMRKALKVPLSRRCQCCGRSFRPTGRWNCRCEVCHLLQDEERPANPRPDPHIERPKGENHGMP